MKRKFVICMCIVGMTVGLANAGVLFSEDFNDGNYDRWTYLEQSPGINMVTATNGYLEIERSNAGASGRTLGIYQDLDIAVSNLTEISFDVQTVYSNVSNGSGVTNWEFPAFIKLTLDTSEGEKVLRFAYNYRGGSDFAWEDGYQVGIGDAPQNVWLHNEQFNITEYFPTASRISEIGIFGSGWDFSSKVDNIQIVPEPCSLGLLVLGGLIVRRRKAQ